MAEPACEHCVALADELTAERAARAADAEAARDELHRVTAEAGTLLRTVSHDVRTPLNNVFGALELAEMLAHQPADLARWLGVARASSIRLRLMLDDLVAHARHHGEQDLLPAEPVGVADAVEAAVVEARELSIARQRTITVDLGGFEGASVAAQADELRHVVVDLVVNALLHRTDGDVVVRVRGSADACPDAAGTISDSLSNSLANSLRFEVIGDPFTITTDEEAVLNRPFRPGDEQHFASDGFALTVAAGLLRRFGSALELQRDERGFIAMFDLPLTRR